MEEKEKTASYYINKYKLQRQIDPQTFEITYEKELHTENKNILIIMAKDKSSDNFSILKQIFYKRSGIFGEPRYIENITNDIGEMSLDK